MNEREFAKQKGGEQVNTNGNDMFKDVEVEERLARFYGPELREQPLSTSAWHELRARLGPHQPPGHSFFHQIRLRLHPRRGPDRRRVPANIQTAFSQIACEAHLPDGADQFACSLTPRAITPTIRVALVGKRKFTLRMSSAKAWLMAPSTIDVLVATGLARSICMRKPAYLLRFLVLGSIFPLVCVALVLCALLWRQNLPAIVLLLAIVPGFLLCVVSSWLYSLQSRHAALLADSLMVTWIGRDRACQGLHALADLSRAPSRRSWGDLSLNE